MAHDQLRLITKAISIFIPLGIQLLGQYIRSIHHRWTYKVVDDAKNVVVVGGSFAGLEVAKRLAETLPTGFRLVLIEKNSHFNYLFHFPRFSVVQGHERTAFVPFDNLVTKNAPNGIFTQIRSTVTSVSDGLVHLSSGETIDFEVLVLATGALQPPPAKVVSTDREEGCAEFRAVQQQIKESTSIAVIGAGAVGVELASDIKDFYPDKKVALIHSRGQVMNRFPKRLHDAVLPALEELGVCVILNERPVIPGGVMGKNVALTFADGREELFDLVIPCTGQIPNSSMLSSFLPASISSTNSRILVEPTLQVSNPGEKKISSPIFAIGDVAEHGGPMMARASFFQAFIVVANVLAVTEGRKPYRTYKPRLFIEGAIKLTLGISRYVVYSMDNDGSDVLLPGTDGKLDLDIRKGWRQIGADPKDCQP